MLKFAGDAIIVMFSTESDNLAHACKRAVACALEIQRRHRSYQSDDLTLACHIGIGAGPVFLIHVGGVNDNWEFLVAGDPLRQLESAVDSGKAGDVVVSREAFVASRAAFPAQQLDSGDYLILAAEVPDSALPPPRPLTPQPLDATTHAAALRRYLSQSVLSRIDANLTRWIGELRRVTVLFVGLSSIKVQRRAKFDHLVLHDAVCAFQRVIFKYQGTIRQALVDDKGTVLIAVFGVPPYAHADDARRGVQAALGIQAELWSMGVLHSIGVTYDSEAPSPRVCTRRFPN